MMMRGKILQCASFILILCIVACEDIFLENISDETVTLLAPEDSIATQSSDHIFIWDKLDGALQYQVIISSGAVIADTITTNTSYKAQLDTGVFQWCIRGLSGDYRTQFSCRVLKIVEKDLKDITADVVELVSPLNNLITQDSKQVFLWEGVAGATQYQLIIASPSVTSPDQVVVSKLLTSTTYTAELEPGKYEWCVKALNQKYKTENSCNFLEIEVKDGG